VSNTYTLSTFKAKARYQKKKYNDKGTASASTRATGALKTCRKKWKNPRKSYRSPDL